MTHSRRPANRAGTRTVLFDIDEDHESGNSRVETDRSMSSNGSGRTRATNSRSRSATTAGAKPQSRRRAEKERSQSVTTNSVRQATIQEPTEGVQVEQKAERVPTIDDRGHVQFSSSMYKNAVTNAKNSARARGALPAGSARSRDPLVPAKPITPPSTVDILSEEEDEDSFQDSGFHENVHDSAHNNLQQSLHDSFQNVYVEEYEDRIDECKRQIRQREREREAGLQRNRNRARSRRQSIYANWSYCGHTFPNPFLRLCTGILFIPIVVCGLIFWPVMAAAVITTILLCVCLYEHAWLSFRIHSQLLATFQWYEGDEGPAVGEPVSVDDSTRSNASVKCGYQDGDNPRFRGSFVSSGYTHSVASHETGASTIIGSDDGMMDDNEKDFTDPMTGKRRKTPTSVYQLEMETSRGVLIGLANNLFCGNLWLTRVTVAGLVTAIWTIVSTTAFLLVPFPVENTPRDLDGTPYYFWVVNFVTTLCAFSCPTWPTALSLVVQKSVFQVLLQNAFNCPLAANRECTDPPLTSMQAYVLGVMAVILVRSICARGPAKLVVSLMLDLLGYAYISGAFGVLITMVDPSDSNATWATIWLGMLGTMWVAQFAAYCCDAMMYRFDIPHMRLLPRHIVVTLDVEASLFAIAAGSLALVFGGALLGVPGGVVPKVLFTVGSVLMARFGRLILSVLKKASGVRWTGRLMPGFGGVLDGTHALLFTSIVFVKYYLYVTARNSRLITDPDGSGDSATWATVTFSTDLED